MKSLLEIISSATIQTMADLDVFIKNTLKYNLCD
jgi:hypothetical protein